MRIQSKIIFHMEPSSAEKILVPLGLPVKKTDTMQVVNIFVDLSQYIDLITTLTSMKVYFSDRQEEIEESELLTIIPNAYCGYPQPDMDGSFREISYDINSACSKCSNGMIQNAPLRMVKPKLGKNDITGIHWVYEYVITLKLKNLIEQAGLTGHEFWPLIDHKKKTPFEELYQLFIKNVMPPMSTKANIVRSPGIELCDCGKTGFMLKGIPAYERESLKSIQDFNKTHEWLGGMKGTWQLPIVSKRVYDLVKENNIRGVRFEPVQLIG